MTPESTELLEALRRWRYLEKWHAMVIIGELEVSEEHAKEASDRALQELRKVADRLIAETSSKANK